MSMTDPIADFLTRVRNAITASHETVEVPASKLKGELARILDEQGYIESWSLAPAEATGRSFLFLQDFPPGQSVARPPGFGFPLAVLSRSGLKSFLLHPTPTPR